MNAQWYDYFTREWVTLDKPLTDLDLDDAARLVPQSHAPQAMLSDLIRDGTNPGEAVMIVLTLMPKSG